MRIILTDDVVGVGDIGETVTVKSGYGRNYLVPRGLAFETGALSAKVIAHKMRQVKAKKNKLKVDAQGSGTELGNVVVELKLRVGQGGKVFGSLGSRDIARELVSLGFQIDRRRILLSEPIRKIGEHTVSVKLHPEVHVDVTVRVSEIAPTKKDEHEAVEKVRAALDKEPESLEEALAEDEDF